MLNGLNVAESTAPRDPPDPRATADQADLPETAELPETGRTPREQGWSVPWLADYVYGTISTLVAIAGLTFETNPGALTTAGVVVGAVAIWLAHAVSRLVTMRPWQELRLRPSDVGNQLRGSWSILIAALPATVVFTLAGFHVWTVKAAFSVAEAVGVLALAAVGFGTVSGEDRPMIRRVIYAGGLVSVGVTIVILELLVHLL